jgi:integrase
MARVRSGSHLRLRGEIWFYRRVVPADAQRDFDRSEVVISLGTTSRAEAERLEKRHDVEFERQLREVRDRLNPNAVADEIKADIRLDKGQTVRGTGPMMALYNFTQLRPEDRELVSDLIEQHFDRLHVHKEQIDRLLLEIAAVLPETPVEPDVWEHTHAGILALVRHQVGLTTAVSTPAPTKGRNTGPTGGTTSSDDAPLYTLAWAYSRWVRAKDGERTPQTVDMADRHFKAFQRHCGLVMLIQVRRSHLVAWRDALVDAGEHAAKSINQRIQLVSAILRAGWRDAEMDEANLKAITLPEPDNNDRGSWGRNEILVALNALEPHSWPAWVYLISLTTSVRLGEPLAARVDWWNPATGFIEVNDRSVTKAHKLHCMPILPCLREPLTAYVAGRPRDEYLFADAPRPASARVGISKVASQWFQRFFPRCGINRVFHELRDTWIEEAKHSPVERDIWEIISGHSALTVSDRYGGKKPDVLAAANEQVCKTLLTDDPEMMAAVLRLVA